MENGNTNDIAEPGRKCQKEKEISTEMLENDQESQY